MNPNSYLTEFFSESESPIMFLDFDGTISKLDVVDEILKKFADKRWLQIERKWTAGKIGSRECLQRQFRLVKATPTELDEFIDEIELDEGLPKLLLFCKEAGIDVHIISDGFDYYIRRMLGRVISDDHLLRGISVWANRLTPNGKKSWRTEFPYFDNVCSDGCATCKPAVMQHKNPFAAPSIFVGDGLSDSFAARYANVVFAKKKLTEFCLENRIPQTTYSSLIQVAESLDQAFESFIMSLYRERGWLSAA